MRRRRNHGEGQKFLVFQIFLRWEEGREEINLFCKKRKRNILCPFISSALLNNNVFENEKKSKIKKTPKNFKNFKGKVSF